MGMKEEILALDDRRVEEVEVPEWGGKNFRVMEMSAADRDSWELEAAAVAKAGGVPRNVRARLVGRCLVDDARVRIFSDAEIDELGKKSAKALDRLFWVAQRVNALTNEEVAEVGKN